MESAVVEHKENGVMPIPEDHTITNPLDMSPELFQEGLDRRKTNRDALMSWVSNALVEDVDFGSIMIKGRKSKPSLFKPGAEKICGMLGMTPTFPNLPEYEALVLGGGEIEQIILRCEMVTGKGQVIAEGVGARSVKQDNGDLNKSLKMCLKSAQIDATLRCAGLSEVFSQDIEDMNWDNNGNGKSEEPAEFNRDTKLGFTKDHKEKTWREVEDGLLKWCLDNLEDSNVNKEFAKQEIEARRYGGEKKEEETSSLVTVKQLERLIQLAAVRWGQEEAEGELHLLVQKKYGVTKVEKITVEQANEIGASLSATADDLIKCVAEKFEYDKPRSVEFLNGKAKEMFDMNTIDSLTPPQLNNMMTESANWDVPF